MPPELPRPPSARRREENMWPEPQQDGYRLLDDQQPDGVSSEDDEEASDSGADEFHTVGQLMSALEEHGVNQLETGLDEPTDGSDGLTDQQGPDGTAPGDTGAADGESTVQQWAAGGALGAAGAAEGGSAVGWAKWDDKASRLPEAQEAERQRQKEAVEQRRQLFGAPVSSPDLSSEQAAAVRRAMAGVRLPEGATPAWAQDLTEQQWGQQLDRLLGRDGVRR